MPLVTKQKATGSHYTPPELAHFLAKRLVSEADFRQLPELRVLDPACGDGELLVALANS
ncbi:MAG: N-6 DNA methylase, partial [Gemmatimonadetes bacterium]|nr:N-6 DNA methylase [Gemmatimonadota bacterium]